MSLSGGHKKLVPTADAVTVEDATGMLVNCCSFVHSDRPLLAVRYLFFEIFVSSECLYTHTDSSHRLLMSNV